jgi:D-alanyl-D-alanine carboxypeptidase/D-alanyl-D-alanine-endopeptidase (penicillin-binding protein 4)
VDCRVVTGPAGSERQVVARRLVDEGVVRLFGRLPAGGKEEIVEVTVPRPAAWFARALREALRREGIRVEGRARAVRWPEPSVVPAAAVTLAEVSSAPLRTLVAGFMKPSQNLETQLVFAHVGERRRGADTPPWLESDDLALPALREFLVRQQVPADDVRFEEGSGLSRNNLTTANATVALLNAMARHAAAADFEASLPVAGVDGTLRRRMKDTPAMGRVRAKTGTLRYANSLAGYVTTAAGERLSFCAMLNRSTRQPAGRGNAAELDEVAVWLAALSVRTE